MGGLRCLKLGVYSSPGADNVDFPLWAKQNRRSHLGYRADDHARLLCPINVPAEYQQLHFASLCRQALQNMNCSAATLENSWWVRALAFWLISLNIGCQPTEPPPATVVVPTPISGPLITVEAQPWPVVVRVQGSLLSDEVSTIAARVVGRIVEVQCDLGDTVKAGEVLVRLDDTEYRLKVIQAEAQLAQGARPSG